MSVSDKVKSDLEKVVKQDFISSNGAYIPEESTKEYYKKRPCPKIVCMAADILEEYLDEHGYLTGKGI